MATKIGRAVSCSRNLALVLARTTRKAADRTRGLTLFLVDLREVRADNPRPSRSPPVRAMFNYETNQVAIAACASRPTLIGEDDAGFRYVIDGWNAKRICSPRPSATATGSSTAPARYAKEREVFGRPSAPTRACNSRWPAPPQVRAAD